MSQKLALHGGEAVRPIEKEWPSWPVFDDKERKAVLEVLESGSWFNGERGEKFRKEYAAFQDAKHCIICNSGTAGLEICLQALGIGPGDEVIVPPYTFIATASAVSRVGATPVFVDVDEYWNINIDLIEEAVTERTRAIIPVHFAGSIVDMDKLNELAERLGLKVIEDACHSWGGKWKGKGTGALGLGGVFSFQMSKNITAGEGGAILTDDDEFAEICESISNCGRGTDGVWYGHVRTGTNARMTEFQAAILSAQLSRLEEQTLKREENASFLYNALSQIEGLLPQPTLPGVTRRPYHLLALRIIPEQFGCTREKFVEAAQAEGWPIGPGYALPLYEQPVYKEGPEAERYRDLSCPVCEDLCYTSAMWSIHSLLLAGKEDMQDLVDIAVKIKENVDALQE